MSKVILILSGGLDSTVLLARLKDALHSEVKALTFNYGQRHRNEIGAACAIARHYCVEHKVIDLTAITPLLKGSSQTDDNVPVPHGHYTEESMKATVVPNRNMIMLSIAGAWAISSKFEGVAYAAHAGDHAIYPDCRAEFIEPLNEAFQHADWHPIRIIRPFLRWTKAEIVEEGNKLHVPFELTWSCYEGNPPLHCGKCGTCVERQLAFKEARVNDPTQYADCEFSKSVAQST